MRRSTAGRLVLLIGYVTHSRKRTFIKRTLLMGVNRGVLSACAEVSSRITRLKESD